MQNINFSLGYTECKYVHFDWDLAWDASSIEQFGYHRLYFLTEGSGIIFFNNGTSFTIVPNVLYFVPAYSIKRTKALGLMYQYFIHFRMDSMILNTQLEISPYQAIPIPPDRTPEIIELFESVIKNAQQDSLGASLNVTGAFCSLLSLALRNLDLDVAATKIVAFSNVLYYIDNNLGEKITLTTLAEVMGYNSNYFSNKFKNSFGMPPMFFLLKKRLSHALQLLTDTDYSVSEITALCGFHSDAYFIKQFKKEFSMTPTRYRKRHYELCHPKK